MIVCIVPNTNKDLYSSIKRMCCIEKGIPSQVVTSRILDGQPGKVKSVITKISIQMSCKLGGEPWGVWIPMKNIMVVGIDCSKDSSNRNKSVCAFVASTNGTRDRNLNCTKYFSKCHIQSLEQRYAVGLEIFMIGILFLFKQLKFFCLLYRN